MANESSFRNIASVKFECTGLSIGEDLVASGEVKDPVRIAASPYDTQTTPPHTPYGAVSFYPLSSSLRFLANLRFSAIYRV
jgi:hypothetical protein